MSAVPLLADGVWLLLAILATPIIVIYLIGAVIVGRIQRGSPIPWNDRKDPAEEAREAAERDRKARLADPNYDWNAHWHRTRGHLDQQGAIK